MALETKLVQKLSQSLMMTPQLQQAIKLLQLGRLEYIEAIQNELLENPVLEESPDNEIRNSSDSPAKEGLTVGGTEESADNESWKITEDIQETNAPDPAKDGSPIALEEYLEYFSDSRGAATPKGLVDYEDRPSVEATISRGETLQEHLAEQLRMLDVSDHEKVILANIIGNLNRDGYLCASVQELAEECACTVEEIENALLLFRDLDPIGIAARDLKECLLIQLENLGMDSSLSASIIQKHLDKLEKRKYDQIAKEESTSPEEVYKAVTFIRSLEPRPGRPFSDESVRYIIPDIYVQKDGDHYVITQNEDGLPRLRLSPYYLDLLRSSDTSPGGQKTYLNERLKAATWLIKSMHQRQQTVYKVTESIVKFQREFLDHGIEKLKPLVLKDVAEDIGMHESTISRVTTNKYVHTPQGVFELKFFFSNGIRSGEGDMSSSSVKEKIRSLISNEAPDNPISDQKIVEILKAEQIDIARRTVAKYRESMNIPSSSQRRRPFLIFKKLFHRTENTIN